MYTRSAEDYDAIYSYKNYRKEVVKLHRLISRYKRSLGGTLLDVGCGTGGHISYLHQHYHVAIDDSSEYSLPIIPLTTAQDPPPVFIWQVLGESRPCAPFFPEFH